MKLEAHDQRAYRKMQLAIAQARGTRHPTPPHLSHTPTNRPASFLLSVAPFEFDD